MSNEDGGVTMTMPKANYSATGEAKLRWDAWSFVADDARFMSFGEKLEAEMRARADGEVFLRALDKLTEQGCPVSDSKNSGNYAPKVMIARELHEDLRQRQLEKAMVLLLNEGRILAGQPVVRGTNRHWRYGLARAAA